jgi:exopolyphosphatase/guanosine-5'-triphosphate,3'-diphosphate pyrophosphatase
MKNTKLNFSALFASLVLPLVFLTSCQTSTSTPKTATEAAACGPEVRAAFDIGSGSTKMKVAKFNSCDNTLTEVLLEDQARVNFQESLQASKDGTFSEEVREDGMDSLRLLLEKALKQNATHFAGVATAAFRKAKNSQDFLNEVDKKLGIHVKIISQEQEALIGFKGAEKMTMLPKAQIVLWDIGGGSQQIIFLNEKDEPVIYFGTLASVSFKNYIISTLQKKDFNTVQTPNPIGEKTTKVASKYVEKTSHAIVPKEIQDRIKNNNVQVIGIGGVLSRSITSQVEYKEFVTDQDIQRSLGKRLDLDDKAIGGEFPQTEISNLILVSGFMKGLKIKQFRPVKASLIDGLWFEKEYWH